MAHNGLVLIIIVIVVDSMTILRLTERKEMVKKQKLTNFLLKMKIRKKKLKRTLKPYLFNS